MKADDGKKPDGDGGGGGGGKKKAADSGAAGGGGGNVTVVVLKMDMHCVGCAKKVKRVVANFDGVEEVQVDSVNKKLTVIGKVDPVKIKEKLQERTNKNVDLISPQPAKKDGGNDKKSDAKAEKKPSEEKQPEDKRHKEVTVVFRIRLHCEECIQKINKIISKFKGVHDLSIDGAKDQVAVTGTMEVGELVPYLRRKLKRSVEVVPPKKDDGGGEKGKKDGEAGDKKDKEKEGDKKGKEKEKERESGGDGGKEEKKAARSAEAGKGEGSGGGEAKVEVSKMEYQSHEMPSPQPTYWDEGHVHSQQYTYAVRPPQIYGHSYVVEPHPHHSQGYAYPYPNEGHVAAHYVGEGYVMNHRPRAPQFFSDENPNACSVM